MNDAEEFARALGEARWEMAFGEHLGAPAPGLCLPWGEYNEHAHYCNVAPWWADVHERTLLPVLVTLKLDHTTVKTFTVAPRAAGETRVHVLARVEAAMFDQLLAPLALRFAARLTIVRLVQALQADAAAMRQTVRAGERSDSSGRRWRLLAQGVERAARLLQTAARAANLAGGDL